MPLSLQHLLPRVRSQSTEPALPPISGISCQSLYKGNKQKNFEVFVWFSCCSVLASCRSFCLEAELSLDVPIQAHIRQPRDVPAPLISAQGCKSHRCPVSLCPSHLGAVPAPNPSRVHTGGNCLSHVPAKLSVLLCDAVSAFVLINTFAKK